MLHFAHSGPILASAPIGMPVAHKINCVDCQLESVLMPTCHCSNKDYAVNKLAPAWQLLRAEPPLLPVLLNSDTEVMK